MAQQDLRVNITGNSSGLSNALTSASSKLEAFGSKMSSVGKSLSTKLTLPLVAAGAAATKLAFDFDKSMTSIQALVGVAAGDVAKMGETAKKMATDTGRSANEAAEALFFITSAGLRGDAAMQVLEQSLKASAIGLGETKTIADLSTSALNAYGVANLSATDATDILTAAVREGKLEASQLATTMGGVIPIASNMGVRFDEVAAAMAAMSRTGTNAAEGATQLNAILASLKKPTAEAEKALTAMGMSTDSVQRSLREQGLLATLEMLQAGLAKTGQDTTAIFPNIRALKGVLDLTGAGLEDTRKIFDALTKSTGATNEAFEKTAQSASFKFEKGMATMKNSLLEIGQVVLPAVVNVVEKLSGFIKGLSDEFKGLSPFTQNLIVTFGGILAAAGPLLIIFGKMMTGIAALGPVLKLAAVGFRALTATMLANPIIAVAAAIAAIGIAIYQYTKAQKEALNESLSIEEIEKRIAEKRKKLASEQARVADGYGGQVKKNVELLKKEIAVLKDKEKAIKASAKALKLSEKESPVTTPTTIAATITQQTAPTSTSKKRPSVSAIGGGLEMADIATPITDAIKLDTALIPQAMDEQQQILLEKRAEALERTMAFNQGLNQIVTGGLNDLAVGIGQSLGEALSSGGNLAQKLSKVVLSTIGSMAQQLGKLAIGIGIGVKSIATALKSLNPAVAIAAGIALVALGAFASSQAGKIGSGGGGGAGATAFANGGIVSGPTMGLVGEYPGARSNPEVIAPLDKLQNMIGGGRGTQNINVGGQIRLEGQDLLIAIERANETAGRIY
jgi:TP901 family phage tail tape measure protein